MRIHYLLNFVSNWSFILFLIWWLSYVLNIKIIYINLNLYYLIYFCFYGYLFYLLYHIFHKKLKYEISFILFGLFLHGLPVYIYKKYNIRPNIYSLRIFFSIGLLYLLYLKYRGKNILNLYFIQTQVKSFDELFYYLRIPSKYIHKKTHRE